MKRRKCSKCKNRDLQKHQIKPRYLLLWFLQSLQIPKEVSNKLLKIKIFPKSISTVLIRQWKMKMRGSCYKISLSLRLLTETTASQERRTNHLKLQIQNKVSITFRLWMHFSNICVHMNFPNLCNRPLWWCQNWSECRSRWESTKIIHGLMVSSLHNWMLLYWKLCSSNPNFIGFIKNKKKCNLRKLQHLLCWFWVPSHLTRDLNPVDHLNVDIYFASLAFKNKLWNFCLLLFIVNY